MDPTRLLQQFLGGSAGGQQADGGTGFRLPSGMGGFAGGAAAGGLLGLLLGKKGVGGMAGGLAQYGGAAALGALALRAYQNWQQGRDTAAAPLAGLNDAIGMQSALAPDAAVGADGQPFQLALIRAMVAAAKADGHIDQAEQKRLFESVERMDLDAEEKGFVFDVLNKPADIGEIARAAGSQAQAAELYMASRLAIDPDQPVEKAYLEDLAARLQLPADLVAHLEQQAQAGFSG